MRPSSANDRYDAGDIGDRELMSARAADAQPDYETSGRDSYAEAELRLRSERTEAMIRRAEGYAR